jgi:hypothetical protein
LFFISIFAKIFKTNAMQTTTFINTALATVAMVNNQQEQDPAITGILPEGYIMLEEFRTEAKASLTKILNNNGIY